MKLWKGFELHRMTNNPDVDHYYVARYRPLGLTAYGDTSDEAWEHLKGMFGSLVELMKKDALKMGDKEQEIDN
jgi:hypothetical protein